MNAELFEKLQTEINELPWDSGKNELSMKIVGWLQEKVPHYSWVGIYWIKGRELVLGPWSGPAPTEHNRIPIEKGICGLSAGSQQTVIIGDVKEDPRYLACFLNTRSEIVVPISRHNETMGIIDIDSDDLHPFDEIDQRFLEDIGRRLAEN